MTLPIIIIIRPRIFEQRLHLQDSYVIICKITILNMRALTIGFFILFLEIYFQFCFLVWLFVSVGCLLLRWTDDQLCLGWTVGSQRIQATSIRNNWRYLSCRWCPAADMIMLVMTKMIWLPFWKNFLYLGIYVYDVCTRLPILIHLPIGTKSLYYNNKNLSLL